MTIRIFCPEYSKDLNTICCVDYQSEVKQVSRLHDRQTVIAVEEYPTEAIIDIWKSGECKSSFKIPYNVFSVQSETLLNKIIETAKA